MAPDRCGRAHHATCVAVGEVGVLIRGASGSGKSQLGRAVIAAARQLGLFGSLVADDRTCLDRRGGRLVARPHPAIAGLMEVRGLGIVQAMHEAAIVVRLVADLEQSAPRMPLDGEGEVIIEGVKLPRIRLQDGDAQAILLALGYGVVHR